MQPRGVFIRQVLLSVLGLMTVAAPASAATGQVQPGPTATVLTVEATGGEVNQVQIRNTRAALGVVRIKDYELPLTPGAGCEQDGAKQLACAVGTAKPLRVVVRFKDRNDSLSINVIGTAAFRVTNEIWGGAGRDHLQGDIPSLGRTAALDPFSPVELHGEAGDDLLWSADFASGADGDDQISRVPRAAGGSGDDTLLGTVRRDVLRGGPDDDYIGALPGDDRVEGGAGDDNVIGHRGEDSLDGAEGDDDLAGNTGDDWLNGWRGADSLFAGEGNDRMFLVFEEDGRSDRVNARGGDDFLEVGCGGCPVIFPRTTEFWQPERDVVTQLEAVQTRAEICIPAPGGGECERIRFGPGDDEIIGNRKDNRLSAGQGNDFIDGRKGADQLFGEDGADRILARDGVRDLVDCGDGQDTAMVDRFDRVRNCEDIRRRD